MLLTKYRAKMIAKLYKPYLASGVDVLDIGCGNGEVSDYFLNKFEIKLVGTDIDQYLKKKIKLFFESMKKSENPVNYRVKKFGGFKNVKNTGNLCTKRISLRESLIK